MASKFLKANPALQPLVACVGAGVALSGLYLLRLTKDGVWSRSNPYPWQRIPQDRNTHFLTVQGKDPKEVFKPQSADDLRGKI